MWVTFNDFGLFWISTDPAGTLGIFSRWDWEWMGASCCCQHPSAQPSLEQKVGFGGRVGSWNSCPGWQCQGAPGTARSSGTAAPGRDILSSSGTGNSVGAAVPALRWVRFGLGSNPAQSLCFLGMSGLCVPAKTGENRLEPMGFATNPLPDCAAEQGVCEFIDAQMKTDFFLLKIWCSP